ncbi:MAG: Phosphoribosyl-ATP pyrophosphatase [Rickettsiaceae bacterium]|jgi:phosphoribosyl-ATP pyrophosphohydrolase|nr:Phosphoribosyl-ATP pyrophosphatase [Rickettsiaceae bacterium]
MEKNSLQTLDSLFAEIKSKIKNDDPESSYTAFLANAGSEIIAKKVVEEAFETAIASIDKKNDKKQIILETADLFYHTLVLLANKKIELKAVIKELEARRKKQDLSKKAIAKNKAKLYGKRSS